MTLHLIDSAGADASRTLHQTMSQREALRPLFRAVWSELATNFGPADLEAWSAAVLKLVHVNAGGHQHMLDVAQAPAMTGKGFLVARRLGVGRAAGRGLRDGDGLSAGDGHRLRAGRL